MTQVYDPSAFNPTVAYFSMEIGLDSAMPTYAGGLGILAGDALRAAADLEAPIVGVSLLHRKGYFRQYMDASGNQTESPATWSQQEHLELLPQRTSVTIEGREVHVQAWRYLIKGASGHTAPVLFLDTALPENSPWDQTLTDYLYGGDDHYRLCQEVVLGIGGVAMLRAANYKGVRVFHMNEGHSALLTLALLKDQVAERDIRNATPEDREAVRGRCVFTTHTPVPAGHDQFPMEMARRVMGDELADAIEANGCCPKGILNMTFLALFLSRYINGVSMRHEEISQSMYPNYPINSITNGVHAVTWASPSFSRLFDQHMRQWRRDNHYLRYAIHIPLDQILQAHAEAKRELIAEVERRRGVRLRAEAMTIGFARRSAPYKRGDMLFSDLNRLKSIASHVGPLQVVYAGKAHPRDEAGKDLIRRIFQAGSTLGDSVPVVYLEDYDMSLSKVLCAGADLWLNTPQKPLEASGTSGMKAGLNGVPNLSVLDGWWVEGHIEGVTVWSIGENWDSESDPSREITSMYDKLQYVILPMFYGRVDAYAQIMRSAIAYNGSFFNAQRMIDQYIVDAYGAAHSV